jgi:hypothetical protein
MKHKIITGEELFDLVHSLTKAEKRHFKLVTRKEKGEKFYLLLFDLLNEQETYDEREVLKKISSGKSKKNYSQARIYLFEKIIASLHSLGTYKNADSQVKDLIETAKLLRYKGLYNQAQRYLERAEGEAIEGEAIYNRLFMNFLEYNFSVNTTGTETSPTERTHALNVKGKLLYAELGRFLEVYHIFRLIKSIEIVNPHCRSREEREKLDAIVSPLRTIDPLTLPGAGSQIHFHLASSIYNSMIGKHTESVKHCTRVLELVKAHPKIDNTIYPQLSNLVSAAIKAKQVENIEGYLAELIDGIRVNPDFHEQKLIYERWLLYYIQYYNYQGEFRKAVDLHRNEKDRISHYNPFTRHIHFQLLYHLAISHFYCGNYAHAWTLMSSILNEYNTRSDLFLYARIFSLVILYEQKESTLLPHAVRSAYRLLLKKNRSYGPEKVILEFIRSAAKSPGEKMNAQLSRLSGKMEKAFEDPYDQSERYYFDLMRWLRAHSTHS